MIFKPYNSPILIDNKLSNESFNIETAFNLKIIQSLSISLLNLKFVYLSLN